MADTGVILRPEMATVGAPAVIRRDAGLHRRMRRPIVTTLLIAADTAAASAVALAADVLGAGMGRSAVVTLPLIFVVLCCSVGLYSAAGPSPYERFRQRGMATFYAVALSLLISAPVHWVDAILFAACEVVLLTVVGHYMEVALRAALVRAGLWAAPAVVVSCDETARRIVSALLARPDIGLAPIGFATVRGHEADSAAMECSRLLPFLGTASELDTHEAEVAIFTSAQDLARVMAETRGLSSVPRLVLAEDIPELGSLWLHPRMLGDAIGMEVRRDYGRRSSQAIKRAIDLVLAIPAALLALPVVAVLAALIAVTSPGPALYRQERVGRNGRPIRIVKLRTMYADAERRLEEHLRLHPEARAEWERFFKLKNDPRILPVLGNFIRRYSLDELPQLWNVIRGDVSLVGPRPFPAYHMEGFDPEFRALRTSVQPGLTGIWQISARSNGDLGVQKTQDLFYIKNRSLWLDLYIMLQTVPAVLRGAGAC